MQTLPTTRDRFATRFDGAAAWATLSPDVQAAIGAIALELVVCWEGQDDFQDEGDRTRPFDAADPLLNDSLRNIVHGAIPDVLSAEPVPVPSILGPVCRACGCSEEDACAPLPGGHTFGCSWAEPDLCDRCLPGARP